MALFLGLLWLLSWLRSRWPELEAGRRRWGGSPGFPSYQRVVTRPRCPLAFFFVHVCMCVRQYRPVRPGTISVELLRSDRKLNSSWKVKPRDGKNKDGVREQDKEEVRVPVRGYSLFFSQVWLEMFQMKTMCFKFFYTLPSDNWHFYEFADNKVQTDRGKTLSLWSGGIEREQWNAVE